MNATQTTATLMTMQGSVLTVIEFIMLNLFWVGATGASLQSYPKQFEHLKNSGREIYLVQKINRWDVITCSTKFECNAN